jgi:adenylyl-sulfate kinase
MNRKKAIVLWFTGLSGSGKTTIAMGLKEHYKKLDKKVLVLDGDVVREKFHKTLGFSREEIRTNNRLIAEMAKKQLNDFDYILVPIISPYGKDREMAKKIIGDKYFFELFVNTPLEECISRDPKGLYKKAQKGEINNLIGVSTSNPYEEPEKPEIIINTKNTPPSKLVQEIVDYFKKECLEVMR